MTRADFWCRVLGWVEMAGSAAFAGFILVMWTLFLELFQIEDVPAITFLIWLFVFFAVMPMFAAGLLTVIFANAVEQARNGLRGEGRIVLRVFLALAGLWAAGVIGFAGLSVPVFGIAALLALASAAIAIMGPDWTADLSATEESAS
jgi:hypothetical protein